MQSALPTPIKTEALEFGNPTLIREVSQGARAGAKCCPAKRSLTRLDAGLINTEKGIFLGRAR